MKVWKSKEKTGQTDHMKSLILLKSGSMSLREFGETGQEQSVDENKDRGC